MYQLDNCISTINITLQARKLPFVVVNSKYILSKCFLLKILSATRSDPKFKALANSADPDQTAAREVV